MLPQSYDWSIYPMSDYYTNDKTYNDLAEQIAKTSANRILNNGTEFKMYVEAIRFKKVIFNAPATIVYWSDGSKTVVKCKKDEIFDREKGLAMAISKKALGEAYRKTFKEAEI